MRRIKDGPEIKWLVVGELWGSATRTFVEWNNNRYLNNHCNYDYPYLFIYYLLLAEFVFYGEFKAVFVDFMMYSLPTIQIESAANLMM